MACMHMPASHVEVYARARCSIYCALNNNMNNLHVSKNRTSCNAEVGFGWQSL